MKGPTALSTLTGALLTIAVGGEYPASGVAAQRPQIPAIRTGITLVPIDVRVLDRDYVKAVVYDPNGDLLGSTVVKLRK